MPLRIAHPAPFVPSKVVRCSSFPRFEQLTPPGRPRDGPHQRTVDPAGSRRTAIEGDN